MLLDFENDTSVLDMGCGLGSTVDFYGVPDHVATYGIDIDPEVIEQAKLLHKDRQNRFFSCAPLRICTISNPTNLIKSYLASH